jgi:hypothetical protein
MAIRRRAEQEFEQTKADLGPQIVTLAGLTGGYNGWVTPDILSPQFWAKASNVYSGQFGTIRRARWAPFLNSSATGFIANASRILSMFSFLEQTPSPNVNFILFDNTDNAGGSSPRWICANPLSAASMPFYGTQAGQVGTFFPAPINTANNFPLSKPLLNGPYMRVRIGALILETNGKFRSKLGPYITSIFDALSYWGTDAPDVAASVTLVAGSTATIVAATGAQRLSNVVTITATAALPAGFVTGAYVQISGVADTSFNTATGVAVQITVTGGTTFTFSQIGPNATSGSGTATLGITKTVGRSYQWAWESTYDSNLSAPSPATQFIKYVSQTGTIDLIQPGTVAITINTPNVVGTNTFFSQAWVGKRLWMDNTGLVDPFIISVTDATHLTLSANYGATVAGKKFQIYDPQATNIKLYATGDGGSVYFLIARNVFQRDGSPLASSGLEFSDTANSEPPNPPFSSEITQNFNVPPPIGTFVDQYQGRPIVYGVAGALQSFFYGNIESTVVGQPAECFAPLNQVTLPLGDGKMFGTANLPTGFLIWSNRQDMFKLTGLLSDNSVANQFQLGATIQRLPYKIGCGSPYATAISSLGAFWLSADRQVWLFTDHYAPKNVGVPIQDVLNRINGARLGFAKMKVYKSNDRNWLALAIALDSSTFNNKLCLLDLDLLASNGQPSFFTFDMATNAPTWYLYDVNCEAIDTSYDGNSVNHLFSGDVDLITDLDWQPSYFTISTEQNVAANNTLHAVGNENPEIIKTGNWMRAMTNQLPANLSAQGWTWAINTFDDDTSIIGVTTIGNIVQLIPGQNNPSGVLGLEYSPAKFVFGSRPSVKGRRFQIQTNFPSTPGFYELRGFQFAYRNEVAR